MLRALAAILTRRTEQLELVFSPESEMLARLAARGLRRIRTLVFTDNASVIVSFRGDVLRMHRALVSAPDEILEAVVAFVEGRGDRRREARRTLVRYPIPRGAARTRRRERPDPNDEPLVRRLREAFDEANARHFGGRLSRVEIRVSRRCRRRLGHYAPATAVSPAEIVVSRRHIRRDGWREVLDTLLHEMIHQWQDEQRLPIDHGLAFRARARAVGVHPRARRAVGARASGPVVQR